MNSIDQLKNEKNELDADAITQIIPYGSNFLMIDRVLDLDKNKIIAIKNTNINEYFFSGHFTHLPIMPAVLIIEGIGQAASILLRYNLKNQDEKEILAYKIDNAKFILPIFPNQQIIYKIDLIKKNKKTAAFHGKAIVNDNLSAECEIELAVVNKKEFKEKHEIK